MYSIQKKDDFTSKQNKVNLAKVGIIRVSRYPIDSSMPVPAT
jgi:hypothetical protein